MIRFKDLRLQGIEEINTKHISKSNGKEIAIIGMAAYFPFSSNLDEFWKQLCSGKDFIRNFPISRKMDIEYYLNARAEHKDQLPPRYTKAGYLEDVNSFDYEFFGLSPSEANAMDPNQRLFLEVTWKAIEDAGYGGEKLYGTDTGVYVGFSGNAGGLYQNYIMDINPEAHSVPGTLNPLIASRISYILDLKGPSMLVDSSCSSSLLAVHTACKALLNGECSTAICGGINLTLLPIESDMKLGIESSTDRARTFDDKADGTVSGEGAITVLLKPLHAAEADGDHIYAVIKGSAVNHDGKSNGVTAPNVLAQESVLLKAWRDADISPESLSYIEAHGTGTKLGDPIEVEALTKAFRRYTNKKQFCAISSLKSNIGHLDAAAGIAGLVKAALSLQHKKLPPTLHFEHPNRYIDFIRSPFFVNHELRDWDYHMGTRRCGVSAFGMSGTNCHVVMEQYIEKGTKVMSNQSRGSYLLTLSAKHEAQLKELVSKYHQHLIQRSDIDLERLCYTANSGRGAYAFRLAIIFDSQEDLIMKLDALLVSPNWKVTPPNVYFASGGSYALPANNAAAEFKDVLESYLVGESVRWEKLFPTHLRKMPLPTYPFRKTRCWISKPNTNHDVYSHQEVYGRGNITNTEKIIGDIWLGVLGYEKISVIDNFYELGGDSIHALKIVNIVKEQFKINVELSELLKHQTIESFSTYIDQKINSEAQTKQTTEISYLNKKNDTDVFPLSFAQRGIFFAEQKAKGSTSYNMAGAMDIFGGIDREKLEFALRQLIDTHASLRTSFHLINQTPVQRVNSNLLNIQWITGSEEQLEQLYESFVQPFDLSDQSLFRVCVVQCEQEYHCIFFDMHHIISDGVSMNILIEDFVKLYTEQEIIPPAYQYVDYALWQDESDVKAELIRQENFWIQHLEGNIPTLNMPTDFVRPKWKGFDGDEVRFSLNPDLTKELKEIVKREAITMNILLLAAYVVFLYKHTGQKDIVIGMPSSGRSHLVWERVVGMFVNTMALRFHIKADYSFSDLLDKVRKVIYQALDNDNYPFEWLMHKIDYKFDAGRSPFFDTMFIMQNNKAKSTHIEGLSFVPHPFPNRTSKYDFKMEVYDGGETMDISIDFRTDLFRMSTVQRWSEHIMYILQVIASDLSVKVDHINLLNEQKKKKIINDFNEDLL